MQYTTTTDATASPPLIDGSGREISYLRLSITDRCNLRCHYCITPETKFVAHRNVLTLEESARLARIMAEMGIRKIRLTGGEPLVRRDIDWLLATLGGIEQLEELVLTTNGTLIPRYVDILKAAGINRINLSLDTLQRATFLNITGRDELPNVLKGLDAALNAGFTVRLNTVVLKGHNDHELGALVDFADAQGVDICFIEHMPVGTEDRDLLVPGDRILKQLRRIHPLDEIPGRDNGGPANYWQIRNRTTRIGLITPISRNFCNDCNRIRITTEGRLILCLDNRAAVDLRPLLRDYPTTDEPIRQAVRSALLIKPVSHNFNEPQREQPIRFMNATGG